MRLPAALIMAVAVSTPAAARKCVDCHKKTTPNIVTDRQLSKHAGNEVDCSACHGSEHTSEADAAKARIRTPETCKGCHPAQADQSMRQTRSGAQQRRRGHQELLDFGLQSRSTMRCAPAGPPAPA